MRKGRCLGLVGGLGVGATIHYYKELVRGHDAQGRTLDIVITHAETSRVFEYIQASDPNGLVEYLNSFLQRLKAAGAELAIVPAITPLYASRELADLSPLPLISMADAVDAGLASRSARRVAIFGTRYSVESGFFGLLENVEVIRPQPDEVDTIHSIYTELLRDGKGTDEQHGILTALARTLQSRDKVDAILMAGTDLAVLFNPANTEFPHVDCAALHLEVILREALGS